MRLPLILLIAAIFLGALSFALSREQPPQVQSRGEANIGGTFTLIDTQGHTVKDSDFRGRLMLVYMGYSHCPDVCPLTLSTISDALKSLGPDADKIAVLFISLDPERDTPQALAQFLSSFDPRITGLTGSKEAIDQAAQAYKIFHKKVETPNTGSYLIDHSGFLYLMDRNGKYVTHFDTNVKADELGKAIRSNF